MATWFSGTSTDNKYQVGQSYIGSQGDRMTAQADGSFYNERTGRSSVGSSQDSSVQWSSDSASDRMPGFWTDQGRYVPGPTFGSAGVGYDATPGGVATGGAGGAGAGASGSEGPGRTASPTRSNRGAFLDQIGTVLAFDKPSKVMPLIVGGRLLAHDTGWSNVADWEERTGESEFLSPTWFASWGVAGADAWANASVESGGPIKTRKVQEDLYNAPGVAGGVLRSLGQSFLDTRAEQRDPFGPDFRKPGSLYQTGGF